MSSVSGFGDSAVLVDVQSTDPRELARSLSTLDGVEEVVPGAVICVRFAPGRARAMWAAVEDLVAGAEGAATAEEPAGLGDTPRLVELRVAFDGPDLEEVAARTGMSTEKVIRAIEDAVLQVEYLGFSPGFAYVRGLRGPLAALERRPVPRTSVPAGAVGIAGGYLGIYPQASPGGWNLVGRTDAELFDPGAPPYSALQPGDRLKLVRTDEVGPAAATMTPVRPRSGSTRRVEVTEPGVLTTLQDSGRTGVAHLGVPRAGPADRDSMRLANLTVGNSDHDGVLESTVSGPTLRFHDAAHAVVVGASWELNGRSIRPGVVVEVPTGGTLRIGATSGLRSYLAVAGGLRGPELFGSFSSDLLCGLGPGPLQVGDELDIGKPGQARGYAAPLLRSSTLLRLIPGPHRVDDELLSQFTRATFKVSPDSNRIGVRLVSSHPLTVGHAPSGAPLRRSHGMVPGAVQIPPSGGPIVLLCDHATMGGYPVIGTVITADLGVIAQRRPGESLQFEIVHLDQAIDALAELDRQIAHAPTGIYPTGPVT